MQAAAAQLARLPAYHLFGGKSYAPAIELAERLLALAGADVQGGVRQFRLQANDTAVKLVRYYHHALGKPRKTKIIARTRAYHGVTLASASLTGLPQAHQDFGLPLQGCARSVPALLSRCRAGRDRGAVRRALALSLERLILSEGPDTVGAFIAEPLMERAG